MGEFWLCAMGHRTVETLYISYLPIFLLRCLPIVGNSVSWLDCGLGPSGGCYDWQGLL